MSVVYETIEEVQMAEQAEKDGGNGLLRTLRLRGLLQLTHLISTERYDDARKVVDVLERVKAI